MLHEVLVAFFWWCKAGEASPLPLAWDSPSKYGRTGGQHKTSALTLKTIDDIGPWPAPFPELNRNLSVFPCTAQGAGEQKWHKTASSNTLQNSLQK